MSEYYCQIQFTYTSSFTCVFVFIEQRKSFDKFLITFNLLFRLSDTYWYMFWHIHLGIVIEKDFQLLSGSAQSLKDCNRVISVVMKIFIYRGPGKLHGHDTIQKLAPWPCPDCFLVQTNLCKKLILTQGNGYRDVHSMYMYLISISFI